MPKRKYTLRSRAVQQEETRQRIVDATMHLHEEVGPSRTTISAIARRAGVERLTVYRHFPEQKELFRACSTRFLETIPPPDPSLWEEVAELSTRTRTALESFYIYYRRTEPMWESVIRDLHEVEALASVTKDFQTYLDQIRDDLLRHWKPSPSNRRTLRAILGHALHFPAWQSLASRGLTDPGIATLMTTWIESVRED